jgi:TraM recognition site of TraD and TraG
MKNILLGFDHTNREAIRVPSDSFNTHWHLIGGTGKGKTTAIHRLLHKLFCNPRANDCFFIFDRMGNLSQELLLWMASPYCPPFVRDRLIYLQPAHEDVVIGFNPLLHETPARGFYKVSRATEIILRAWEDPNIQAMPRLARWTFNAFFAASQLGLTIADCVHLVMPGSDYHQRLLDCLPPSLQYEWAEIRKLSHNERSRMLESTQNRLKPFFDIDILRRMFGTSENTLDVLRFMQQGKIVLINLHPGGLLSDQVADCIGSLILNEILATARSLPLGITYPTYVFLDEFQNFVGPDIQSAIPEVRQLGIRLVLSHQDLSQLVLGEYDLTSMIFQAQSRLIFGVQGPSADDLAQELASLSYDPYRIKDELYSRRQLVTGHSIIELASTANAQSFTDTWNKTYTQNWSAKSSKVRHPSIPLPILSAGDDRGRSEGDGKGGSQQRSSQQGTHETLLPEYEQFLELSRRTYFTFEEQKQLWAQKLRLKKRGEAILRLVDDPTLYDVDVKRDAPGHLKWDTATIRHELPALFEEYQRLIAGNFQSDIFLSPQLVDQRAEERLHAVLNPTIHVQTAVPDDPRAPAQLRSRGARSLATTRGKQRRDAAAEKTPLL